MRSHAPGRAAIGRVRNAEREVLVDLVGDDDRVVAGRRARRRARGSRRRAPAPVGLCGEFTMMSRVRSVTAARSSSGSGRQSGNAQRHRAVHAAGARDERRVGVVVRLEGDDLVAGVDEREDRRGERLGRAGGDEHLGCRVDVDAVEPLLVARRSPREAPACPMPGGYWLTPSAIAWRAASSTSAGPSSSGKPWPEVDRAGAQREGAHLGEDRRGDRPSSREQAGACRGALPRREAGCGGEVAHAHTVREGRAGTLARGRSDAGPRVRRNHRSQIAES